MLSVVQQEEEYFDLVDTNNNLLGKSKLRKDVHRDGDWHRAIHLWIQNSNGDLLLQKRSKEKKLFPNLWHMAVAGHVEHPTSLDCVQTCIKEAKEELGIDLVEQQLTFLFTLKWKYSANGINDAEFE